MFLSALLDAGVLAIDLHLGPKGETLLHRAAEGNHLSTAKLLLQARSSTHVVTSAGDTPMHAAARENSVAVAELLLGDPMNCVAAASLTMKNADGLTPLQCVRKDKKSASARDARKLQALLEKVVKDRARQGAMEKQSSIAATAAAAAAEMAVGENEVTVPATLDVKMMTVALDAKEVEGAMSRELSREL